NQHALIFKDFSRTKDIVASSAAALVGGCAYKGTPRPKSTGHFKKLSFFPWRLPEMTWRGPFRSPQSLARLACMRNRPARMPSVNTMYPFPANGRLSV
ncbi:hypothetical protein, partial [Pseudorhizobium halotolerans]|uniref:hypothetical protein n=1 Tax=Pseudorhizobium halotolerans TaxID=1233081 RepID=UPI001B7D3B95